MKNLAKWALASGLLLTALAGPAMADVIVDGVLDTGYTSGFGTHVSVAYDPLAPDSNFGTPTNASHYISYDIYTTHDANNWYGFFQTNPGVGQSSPGTFANLYFDIDVPNGNGSDIGFELSGTNQDVFIPGIGGNTVVSDIQVATGDGILEVAIPDHYFTTPLPGLPYYPDQDFVTPTDPDTVLRLSQTFGYSVAGGDTYGDARLGEQNLFAVADVPEPTTLSLMGAGLALLGLLAFARRRMTVRA